MAEALVADPAAFRAQLARPAVMLDVAGLVVSAVEMGASNQAFFGDLYLLLLLLGRVRLNRMMLEHPRERDQPPFMVLYMLSMLTNIGSLLICEQMQAYRGNGLMLFSAGMLVLMVM
jgi:hypothetical protein